VTLFTTPLFIGLRLSTLPASLLSISCYLQHPNSSYSFYTYSHTSLFTHQLGSIQGSADPIIKSIESITAYLSFHPTPYTLERYSTLPIGLVTDRSRHIIGFFPNTTRHLDHQLQRSSTLITYIHHDASTPRSTTR
jgi:hypothetical protein